MKQKEKIIAGVIHLLLCHFCIIVPTTENINTPDHSSGFLKCDTVEVALININIIKYVYNINTLKIKSIKIKLFMNE